MNITLRELRVFRAVYELRSFSIASGAMHMTQSAVSKVCQEMENKIGGMLFERSSRKMAPTALADHLYRYACEILGTMDAAERSLKGLLNLEVGELRIGASPMMMHGLLTGPVQSFHTAHPGVKIGLHELSTDETIDHVIGGKVDFGVVSMRTPDPRLTIEALYRERMHLVCSREHALALQPALTWAQLAAHPHVSLHRSFSVRCTVDRIYEAQGLQPVSMIEAGSVVSVLGLVKSGLGVAVLPGYILRFAGELGLACRELPDAGCSHDIALIQRWNARPSMAAEVMISLLRSSLAGGGGDAGEEPSRTLS
jgi:DNA-binding transcriptional LysR family regulator